MNDVISMGSDSNRYIAINDPTHAFPWTTRATAGTQAPGLDYWLGTAASPGPYTNGVVTFCKVKWEVINNQTQNDARGFLVYADTDQNSLTRSASASAHIGLPGVSNYLYQQPADNTRTLTIKRNYRPIDFFQLDSSGDAFAAAYLIFSAGASPSIDARAWLVPYDVATDAFILAAGIAGLYMRVTVTFYLHLRLQLTEHFFDA